MHRALRAGLIGGLCVYGAELEYSIEIARASRETSDGAVVVVYIAALLLVGLVVVVLAAVSARVRRLFAAVILAAPLTVGVVWAINLLVPVSIASSRFWASALLDAVGVAAVFAGVACLIRVVPGLDALEPPAAGGIAGPVRRAGRVVGASAAVRWSALTVLVVLLAAAAMTDRWVGTEDQAPAPGPAVYVSSHCTRPVLARAGGAIPADFHPVRVLSCAARWPAGANPAASTPVLTQSTGAGNLAAVVAAIHAGARGHQHWNGSCASAAGAGALVFVDASGHAVLAALPYGGTSCLKAPHDLHDVLGRLDWSPTVIVG